MKGFSVITNFGCKSKCPYCVWKMLPNETRGNAAISVIKKELMSRDYIQKFSISGGGDPFNVKDYKFWKDIISVSKQINKKFDVHTSYSWFYNDMSAGFFERFVSVCSGIVLHCSPNRFDPCDIRFLAKNFQKVRVNFVVTSALKVESLIKVEEFLKKYNVQLAYRELVGFPELKPLEDTLDFTKSVSDRYEKGRFVFQDDYNEYLFPDGQVRSTFLKPKTLLDI